MNLSREAAWGTALSAGPRRAGLSYALSISLTCSALLLAGCGQVRDAGPTASPTNLASIADQAAGGLGVAMGAAPPQISGDSYRSQLASLADQQALELAQQASPLGSSDNPVAAIDTSAMIAAVAAENARQLATAAPAIVGADQPAVQMASMQPNFGPGAAGGGAGADPRDVAQVIGMLISGQDAQAQQFYRQRGNKPAWYSDSGWSQAALVAHSALRESLYDGLPSFRYGAIVTQALPDSGLPADVARADLALTQAMLSYLVDLRDGLDRSKRGSDGNRLLERALKSGNLASTLDSLRPKNQHYVALAKALRSGGLTDKQRGTVLVNMERFRKWQPPHRGRYIQVNLPSQQLYGFDGDQVSIQMPVIVGQLSRQTPVLSDRITDLKFSPDWTVPGSIADEDIIPILQRKGASAVKDMNLKARQNGRTVDLASINWSRASSQSVQLYQPPGPNNALGGVRFSLTNPRGIYLHDTPDRDLFDAPQRVISSGCVRVGNAPGLAEWVLANQGWNRNRILEAMNRGKTETVPLNRALPVEFTYYTAYAEPNGDLRFWADVYGLDRELAMALGI